MRTIVQNRKFKIVPATILIVIVAAVGVKQLFFSSAATTTTTTTSTATSTTCPNLTAGECRPYDDQSPFNQPIPVYDPVTGKALADGTTQVWQQANSATYTSQLQGLNKALTSKIDDCTPNLYRLNGTEAKANVSLTYGWSFRVYDVPNVANDGGASTATGTTAIGVPTPTKVSSDTCDGQVVFWNPLSGDEWGFWFYGEGGANMARNGFKTKTLDGFNGRFSEGGGRGAGTTYFSGLVRKWEIKQGVIEHALSFAFGNPVASTFVYPAGKTDGAGGTSIPEGTRFQLDPTISDNEIKTWKDAKGNYCVSACLTIAHALQKYGMYAIDNSGSSKIYLEADTSAHWNDSNDDGVADSLNADTAYVANKGMDTPSAIPWNKLRVVAPPCTATSTSNCPTTTGSTPSPSDSTSPTASITAPITGGTVSGSTPTVSANATDNVGVVGVQFKLDGANLGAEDISSPYSITWDTTKTSNGSHTLTATSRDVASNTFTSTGVTVTVSNLVADTTAPDTTITSTNPVSTTSSSANISFSGTDNSASALTYECSLDSATYSACTSPKSYSSLAVGTHTINVRAKDAAGNLDQSPASQTWTIVAPDTIAPTVSVTSPANGTTILASTPSVSLSASASDNSGSVAHVDFYIDNVLLSVDQVSPYQANWNVSGLKEGTSHAIKAIAYDASDNQASAQNTIIISNPDTTAPTTPTNLSAVASSATKISLSWTASTDNVGVAGYRIIRNDGVNPEKVFNSTVTSYSDTSTVASTTYSYTVLAYDATNNISGQSNPPTSVTTPAPTDTTGPVAPVGLSVVALSDRQVNVAWSATTDPSGVKGYNLYRNGTKINTTLITNLSLLDGTVSASTTYIYSVSAVDGVGNEGPQSGGVSTTTPSIAPPPATIITLNPSDDTYVANGSSNTRQVSNGSSKSLQIVTGSGAKDALLKFNVTGVGSKIVTSAKLRLYVMNDSNNGGAFHKITNNSWKQGTVNWNTLPPFDQSNIATLGAVSLNKWVEVDITSLISGDGTYGILINSTSSNTVGYTSSETTNKPQLVLGVQ